MTMHQLEIYALSLDISLEPTKRDDVSFEAPFCFSGAAAVGKIGDWASAALVCNWAAVAAVQLHARITTAALAVFLWFYQKINDDVIYS